MAKTNSKMVDDRTSSSRQVSDAYNDGVGFIVSFLDEKFGAGTGEHARLLLASVIGDMSERRNGLEAAIQDLVRERSEGDSATVGRDQANAACRQTLSSMRSALLGAYGTEYLGRVGLGGPIPERPEAVLSTARYVIAQVPKVPVPKPVLPGTSIDMAALTASLVEPTELLDSALRTVSSEKKQSDGAQIAKDEAMAAFDRSFTVAAGLLSSFLEVCGQSVRARRVRPSTRRPGSTVEVASEELESVEDEPAAPTVSGPNEANG